MAGPIALLIVGAAIMPLQPNSLGCKYGEYLSDPVVPLGAWGEKPQRRMLCKDGPGDVVAYETIETVCARALQQVTADRPRTDVACIPIPTGYTPPRYLKD